MKRRLIRGIDYKLARFRNWFPQFICGLLGGHDWGDWIPRASYNIMNDRKVHYVQECRICDKREYVRAPDDHGKAVEPNYY